MDIKAWQATVQGCTELDNSSSLAPTHALYLLHVFFFLFILFNLLFEAFLHVSGL